MIDLSTTNLFIIIFFLICLGVIIFLEQMTDDDE